MRNCSLQEECGLFGIFSKNGADVVEETYLALYALQHRGQESCGITVSDRGVFTSKRDTGLITEVFSEKDLKELESGQIAIGHVRYAPSAKIDRMSAQPLVIRYVKGSLAIGHNGELVNAYDIRNELERGGSIFQTDSDAELIAYLIAKERLAAGSVENALAQAMKKLKGAFSIVVMSPNKLIAARDPLGIRPLSLGQLDDETWVVASETCAFDSIGAKFVRDIEQGEVLVISKDGMRSIKENCGSKTALCIFEYVYFARPDSVIQGQSVHLARQNAGMILAKEHPIDADIVCGVPDSGLDAALGYSIASGIPYGLAFIKNKYIGRTFIQDTQKKRERAVKIKLNALAASVKGKRVVLIDDSIVRGTTCAHIVRLLREAGATEVHMRISSPPFLYPCFFGTDIKSKEALIACKTDLEGVRKYIGADTLGYLSIDGIRSIAPDANVDFCDACFTGNYPVDVPNEIPLNKFTQKIKD